MFKFKGRLLYLIIPFVIVGGLAFASDYQSAYEIQEKSPASLQLVRKPPTLKAWLKENETYVGWAIAAGLPLAGWLFHEWRKSAQKAQEAGRQQFLALATTAITDSVSERLVAKLEMLEERIEWIYKEISNFESKLHVTDNEINQIRLELTRLTTDVKVLRATRREFLHRLNEQLQAAENQLASIVNNYCAGHSCQDYKPRLSKPIEDPFDNSDNDTLF